MPSTSFRARGWWLPTLVLLVGLGLMGQEARAGGDVDWSDFIEPPGSNPPPKAAPSQPKPVRVAAKKTSRKVAKKRVVKSRAKAKRAAANKRRR